VEVGVGKGRDVASEARLWPTDATWSERFSAHPDLPTQLIRSFPRS